MWMQRPSLITTGPCLYAPFNFPKRVTQLVVTLSGWGPIFRKRRRLVRRGREPVTHSYQNLHFSARSWDDHHIEVKTGEGTLVGGIYNWSLNSAGVRVPYFHTNPSVTRVSPPHTEFPTSGVTLSNTVWAAWVSETAINWGGKWYTWTCAVQTGVVQESAVLPELQVSMLAHMFNILVSFLLLTFQACVNSHLNCHYLYSQDILLTIFLYTSFQLEVYSRSYNGYFIWKPYDRNLHWHSISGCVGNSENLRFYFQIHPQLNQTLPFPKSEECIPDKRPISVDLNSPSVAFL